MAGLAVALMYAGFDPVRTAFAERWERRAHPERVDAVKDYRRVPDERGDGVWPTARRAWEEALQGAQDAGASHVLVANEDHAPCRDYLATVAALAEVLGSRPFCTLTLGNTHARLVDRAVLGERRWVVGHVTVGGALVLSVDTAREFLGWAERWDGVRRARGMEVPTRGDDTRTDAFFIATGRHVLLTVPSLLEHLLPSERLIGGRLRRFDGATRVARVPSPALPASGWFAKDPVRGSSPTSELSVGHRRMAKRWAEIDPSLGFTGPSGLSQFPSGWA